MKESETDILEFPNWRVRYRGFVGNGVHPVFLLLHGWTGDENSMWVFASRLPREAILIAPRGPYPTPLGGFGWQLNQKKEWPNVTDFRPAVNSLINLLTKDNFPGADLRRLHFLGFSQGAALAFTFAILYPELVQSIGSLSGFLPEDAENWLSDRTLWEKPIFIAHGAQDDLVPVSRARNSVGILERSGGEVIYCEDDVGHKLSASCFRSMEAFYKKYF